MSTLTDKDKLELRVKYLSAKAFTSYVVGHDLTFEEYSLLEDFVEHLNNETYLSNELFLTD